MPRHKEQLPIDVRRQPVSRASYDKGIVAIVQVDLERAQKLA